MPSYLMNICYDIFIIIYRGNDQMQAFTIFSSIIITALIGIYYPFTLMWIIVFSSISLIYLLFQYKSDGYKPKSKTYKALEKLRKKRQKTEHHKHQHINDQITYIEEYWGYTKEQERITEKFIEKRAYSELYNKLTASLIPQVITLIDNCNAREQKGCKREVSRRVRELTLLMKEELKKKKSNTTESFETTLEVYDRLIKEIKP